MKLKVCGLKYQDNITDVASLQPDYLGFIFYEKSPRFVEGNIPELPKDIKKVGVFVNASLEYIIEKIKKHQLQAIQLHGDETPEFCLALRHAERVSVSHQERIKIIKVFSIKDSFNFRNLKPYEAVCDFYLFDTKGKLLGGNGFTFDWTILKNYPSTKPYFLSGGIGLENIENLKSFLNREESKQCQAIDVNSKFEMKPGFKNKEELKIFKQHLSF